MQGEAEMTATQKILEDRLRRAARQQGLQLVKSRRRNPEACGYGRYMLIDLTQNIIVYGTEDSREPTATLGEIEDYLKGDRR